MQLDKERKAREMAEKRGETFLEPEESESESSEEDE